MTMKEHIAEALMKAWFPKKWHDHAWLKSQDGAAWLEIALLDAEVAIKAYEEYYGDDLK